MIYLSDMNSKNISDLRNLIEYGEYGEKNSDEWEFDHLLGELDSFDILEPFWSAKNKVQCNILSLCVINNQRKLVEKIFDKFPNLEKIKDFKNILLYCKNPQDREYFEEFALSLKNIDLNIEMEDVPLYIHYTTGNYSYEFLEKILNKHHHSLDFSCIDKEHGNTVLHTLLQQISFFSYRDSHEKFKKIKLFLKIFSESENQPIEIINKYRQHPLMHFSVVNLNTTIYSNLSLGTTMNISHNKDSFNEDLSSFIEEMMSIYDKYNISLDNTDISRDSIAHILIDNKDWILLVYYYFNHQIELSKENIDGITPINSLKEIYKENKEIQHEYKKDIKKIISKEDFLSNC